jgi:dolichyl-phosphate-mannose-protein mannosyltransferase
VASLPRSSLRESFQIEEVEGIVTDRKHQQYDAYKSLPESPLAQPTPTQSVNAQAPPPKVNPVAAGEQQKVPVPEPPKNEPAISGAPEPPAAGIPGQKILSREERVEYRDQDGNLLNEEQVKELEGKVEFKTRYETRTRVVDANGNEIQQPAGGWPEDHAGQAGAAKDGVAPPHPDVQGVDQETKRLVPDEPIAAAKKSVEGEKENEEKSAKPASESNEATAQQSA